jgi:RimJ/RimL family protein N-acetyltransferase
MEFTIVPITEAHIEGFRAALDAVAREREYLAMLEAPALEKVREFVMAHIRDKRPHVIALVADRVIGWCDISSLHRDVFAHSGVLGMAIVDGFREQGIGQALMKAALERAREAGLTRVELTVRERNLRAKKLYEKFGFVVEGVKRRGVRVDGRYEDLICMGLLLE